jgi:protease IV
MSSPVLRPLWITLVNGLLALSAVLRLPFRLLSRRPLPAYVRFTLRGDPPYRQPLQRRWPWQRPRSGPGSVASLHDLDSALDALAGDGRVRGIVLEVESLAMPAAKRGWVADRLRAFRARGKEVVGYAVSPGNSEYALLCGADRVALPPAGRLELSGFLMEATAIGAALQRLGIHPEFIRRGDYKTAPELFTRVDVSPIQRATLEQFLDERHTELVQAVASGRRLEADAARERVDRGPYSAPRARAAGLVDLLADEVELPRALGVAQESEPALEDRGPVASFRAYEKAQRIPRISWRRFRRPRRLAVVPVAGMLVQAKTTRLPAGPPVAGSETLIQGLRAAAADPRAVAALLYVNSPGGSALASELVQAEVVRLARRKPVVAYVDRVAASGGYMVCLGATELWAGRGSILGSIGVFAGKFDLSGLLERIGVTRAVLTRGDHAGLLSTARPMDSRERQALEAEVDEVYARFLELVATHRNLSPEAAKARAEGRLYTAVGAQEAGLVDQLGGFEEAGQRALALAGRPGEPFELQPYGLPKRRLSLEGLLRAAAAPTVYALWWPVWRGPGLGGTEEFGWGPG